MRFMYERRFGLGILSVVRRSLPSTPKTRQLDINIYLYGFPPHSFYHYSHSKHFLLKQRPDLPKVMSRQ
ncbi:unnamed protein product [Blumeria hordei]|uniref:Uncharacterized protein n=1 Tax=Blumeria hordei TaxID=2867405 RepID=A0A383UPB9_BLUHO|nr:unnamed protein product [Blumeria hordei]